MMLSNSSATAPTAKKVKKSQFIGVGALVQLAGVVCFFLPPFFVFIPVAIVLLIAGSAMSFKWHCSNCGNKVEKTTKICPHPNCGARF